MALAAAVGLLLAPARASAQAVDGKISASLSGGYNAVIKDTDQPDASSGPFMSFSPSLSGNLETPRTSHSLSYSLSLTLPITRNGFDTRPIQYSNKLNYSLKLPIDSITNMSLSTGLTEAPNNQFLMTGDPSETPIDSVSPGTALNLNVTAGESFDRQLSEVVSLTQSLNFTYGNPIIPETITAKTIGLSGSLALANKFAIDTLTVSLNGSLNHFTPSEQNPEARNSFTQALTLSWSRPLTETLQGSVNAGISRVFTPNQEGGDTYSPTGGASLTYNLAPASSTFSYSYSSGVNVFTASMNFSHQLSLRFSMPIGETGLSTSATLGYTHAVPTTTEAANATQTITADASLSYAPTFVKMLSGSVRGQYTQMLPGDLPSAAFKRLGLTVSLSYSWPNAKPPVHTPYFSPGYSTTPSMQPPAPSGGGASPPAIEDDE